MGYNWFDISLPILFIVHIALRLKYKKITENGSLKVLDIFIEIAIYIEIFIKTLQYLRVINKFSFFVQMILAIFNDLWPFFSIYIAMIFLFAQL